MHILFIVVCTSVVPLVGLLQEVGSRLTVCELKAIFSLLDHTMLELFLCNNALNKLKIIHACETVIVFMLFHVVPLVGQQCGMWYFLIRLTYVYVCFSN